MKKDLRESILNSLQEKALLLGATDSSIILTKDIRVEERLAALCNGEHPCPAYGKGTGCPPYVSGPGGFKRLQEGSTYSITIKIDLSLDVLLSEKRNAPMRLLHKIVAAIEKDAKRVGLTESAGFAAGSCKTLFCGEEPHCVVLNHNMDCPYRDIARPSMSGFGIDVIKLMGASGWKAEIARQSKKTDGDEVSWIVGVVVLS